MPNINSLTYNGTKSTDLGVYVTGSGSFDAAEFDVDKYEIPGRNGDLILSNNRYKNVEITYPAFIPKAFMDKVQNVRNWLRSSKVYARLEDTYDMDHYRLGIPTGVQSFSPENRNDGANFEITFDCKPQRFLKVGETPETVEADVQTESGEIVTFETVAESPITSASVTLSPIQSLNGYESPWPGGGGKNLFDGSAVVFNADSTASTLNGITLTKYSNGTFKINGTASAETRLKLTQPIAFKSGNQYAISIRGISGEGLIVILQGNPSSGGLAYTNNYPSTDWSAVYSITEDCTFNYFFVDVQNGASVNFTLSVQIEVGSSPTAWSPYSNICPISGHTGAELIRTGKNLYPVKIGTDEFSNNVGATHSNDNGTLVINTGTGTSSGVYSRGISSLNGLQRGVCSGRTITYSYDVKCSANVNLVLGLQAYGYKTVACTTEWQRVTHTATITGAPTAFVAYSNGTAVTINIKDFQIEFGSSASSYEPYEGTTYSVTFTDQGTVYGGTYDFVTGKLTVTMASVDLGTLNWTYHTQSGNMYAEDAVPDRLFSDSVFAICERYVRGFNSYGVGLASVEQLTTNGAFSFMSISLPTVKGRVVIRDTAYTDAATFKTAMSGVQLVYELASAVEYTLSAQQIETLLGENNLWSDAGPITLTYAEPFTIENPTMFDARPLFTVTNPAEGDVIMVNGQAITFVDGYTGTVYIDCETMNAFSGAANLNSIIQATDFPVLVPGTNIITWTGAGACTITPRWWEL